MAKNYFSGAAKYYDVILGRKKYEQYAKFVSKLLKKFNVRSVLELGCGTGLYLVSLQKKGFDVEGLDISDEMLRELRKKTKNIRLYKQDMAQFKLNKKYDAILILNSSLILLSRWSQVVRTLEKVRIHLHKKGILIIDLPNHAIEMKESKVQERKTYKLANGRLNVVFRDYKKANKWVSECMGSVREGNARSEFKEYYEELLYSPAKLEKILKQKGFRIMRVFGSRGGGAFDRNKSYRRFYLCQKTEKKKESNH